MEYIVGTINNSPEFYLGLACCLYGSIKLSSTFKKSLLLVVQHLALKNRGKCVFPTS